MFMVANPHPCWSLTQNQLPHYNPPPISFPVPIPTNTTFIYTQTALTSPLLLRQAQSSLKDIPLDLPFHFSQPQVLKSIKPTGVIS
jgi:hypothetical protein